MGTEQTFRDMFGVAVRIGCEAVSISPKKKTVDLRDVATGKLTTESYDKLVLSSGAADPAAAPRHRPSGNLPAEVRPRRPCPPRVAFSWR